MKEEDQVQDIREFYIMADCVDTRLGKLHFTKVKDYPTLLNFVPLLELEKFEIINILKQAGETKVVELLQDKDFVVIIRALGEQLNLHEKYKDLFKFIFKEDIFDGIFTDEEFEYYRDLIRKTNCITHEKKNPNPEIEYFNQLKKIYNKRKNGSISFESIYTSVWGYIQKCPDELTIYQLYALFYREMQIKNYDTGILYNSVSGKVEVEPWYKDVDLLSNKKEETTSMDELTKNSDKNFKPLGSFK